MHSDNTDDTISTDNTEGMDCMFIINLQGGNSIYEQIRDQILRYIKLGVLKANDKLPSVRQLALELGINPNTVQKAYQELEKEGYIYTLPKKGAFIASIDGDETKHYLVELENFITKAKDMHVSKEKIIALLEKVYEV